MPGRYGNAPRAISSPSKRQSAEMCARHCGVTPEHLIEVVKARKRYRAMKREHRRRRGRTLKIFRKKSISHEVLYAGEGRFHELLKLAGMSEKQFAEIAGLSCTTVKEWYGFPLYGWPIKLLENIIWARNMAEKLRSQGWDPEKFRAGHLPPSPRADFPRTTEQGRALIREVERMKDEEEE